MIEMIMNQKVDEENEVVNMMQHLFQDRNGLTHQQKRGNVVLFFTAGHDTTASALSWCLYYLATDPEIQQKVRDEITSVLNGEDPTHENLKKVVTIS